MLRVETDADGTYEAHVRKADGTEVEVKMDKDFTITSVEEHGYGHGPMDADDDCDGHRLNPATRLVRIGMAWRPSRLSPRGLRDLRPWRALPPLIAARNSGSTRGSVGNRGTAGEGHVLTHSSGGQHRGTDR